MTIDRYLIAQGTFRILLQGMSRPGRVYALPAEKAKCTAEDTQSGDSGINRRHLSASMIAVLQTLLDHEVTFCIAGHGEERLRKDITGYTGSRAVNVEEADFVVVPSGDSGGAILDVKRGSLEYPDTGATVIHSVKSLSVSDNGGSGVILKGPGIEGEISPFISGINRNELLHLSEINSWFPLGVDTIFIDAGNRIMCIPRSTRIEVR